MVENVFFCVETTRKYMLVEFRVSNYRSICEEQVISLVPASNQNEFPENILRKKYLTLNALALYGANSSGKSNLLNSIELLVKMLSLSGNSNSLSKLPYDPNLLKEGFQSKPTKLEITFVIEETRYRFGVEFNREEIVSEWLYRKRIGREVDLFVREKDTIEVSSGFEGTKKLIDTAIEATRKNALFLSTCDMLNVEEAKSIFQWFGKLIFVDGQDTKREEISTIQLLKNKEFKDKIKEYLSYLDLGFEGLVLQRKGYDFNDHPLLVNQEIKASLVEEIRGKVEVQVNTIHATYDANGKKKDEPILWSMEERESAGTKKAFQFSGPVLYTLLNGGILIVDEIEAKIHPILTLNTINLFLSKETNPLNAQIIFATHDTNLLSYINLRRDQINFVEKNAWEATEVYSLSDFKYFSGQKERLDANKEKRYLEGRYGAVPVLGAFNEKMQEWYGKKG